MSSADRYLDNIKVTPVAWAGDPFPGSVPSYPSEFRSSLFLGESTHGPGGMFFF
jgi:hypothetical protein